MLSFLSRCSPSCTSQFTSAMGKKKKAGSSAVAADAPAAASASAAASAAPAVAPVTQPWPSNYSSMKLFPIQQDTSLFRVTDSLASKVNDSIDRAAAAAAAAPGRFLFGIYDSKADTVGRRAVAEESIPEGTLMLREAAQPWFVHAEHVDKVCHQCAACIYDPSIPTPAAPAAVDGQPAPSKPKSRHLHCSECELVFYCSERCKVAHQPVHTFECSALPQSEDMSEVAQCNIDLVRAAIRWVAVKTLDVQKAKDGGSASAAAAASADASSASQRVHDPYQFQSTMSDSELLMDHLSNYKSVDLGNFRSTAALILRAVPPACSTAVTQEQIVSFFGRINSNCHSLHLELHPTIQFGFGLYPLCAIFNHSCYPNSLFVSEGANLTFRTIRPVDKHEELTVNYVALYAPRTQRRKELWVEKKFFCMCRRCTLKPKNEDERVHYATDGEIGAVACQAPASAAGSSSASASAASSSSSKKDSVASTPAINAASGRCPGFYRINYQPRDPKAEELKSRKRKEARAKRRADKAAAADAQKEGTAGGEGTAAASTSAEAKEDGSNSASVSSVAPSGDLSSDSEHSDAETDGADGAGSEFPLLLRPKK